MKITKRHSNIRSSQFTIRKRITSAEEVEKDENDLEVGEQEFTSKDTSINSTKLPAIYKLVTFPEGSLVLDYGGGRFNNATDWLAEKGVEGLVYDPYNRTQEHNREVVRKVRQNGGADITLCSNVLNVIKEPEARLQVLKNIRMLTKPSGKVYITVYEGKGTGEGKQSKKDSYQLNRKTADYLDEVHQVFPDAQRKGKLIYATPSGEVTAASDIYDDEWFENKKAIINGIKKTLNCSDESANTIYTWYKAEDAFTDFVEFEDFLNFLRRDIWDMIDACDDEDIKISISEDIESSCSDDKEDIESAVKSYDKESFVSKLYTELHHKLLEVMTSTEFGFSEDESDQYSYIDVEESLDGVRVEVRSEISYDGMVMLADALDPVIQNYDKDAYFDQVEPGIMESYLKLEFKGEDINSAEEIMYDDPIDFTKVYDYDFDFNVVVTEDMIDYEDPDEDFEEIYDEDYDMTIESDSGFIADTLLDMVYYNIPEQEGTYNVTGVAKLSFSVYDIYLGYDDEEIEEGSEFYVTDDAEISFDYSGSWIENLKVEKI